MAGQDRSVVSAGDATPYVSPVAIGTDKTPLVILG